MFRASLLVGALLLSFGLAAPVSVPQVRAAGSVITVTTTADGVVADHLCSLREAVISANTDQAVGGCEAGSGADTIVVSPALPVPATFVLDSVGAGEDGALTGDLDIEGNVIIQGVGSDQTILDGNGSDRVFEIRPGARATVSGLTVTSGTPGGMLGGGGILVDATAALALTDSSVTGNTAVGGGGGIEVRGALTADHAVIVSNRGGGLLVDGGGATLTDVDIKGNTDGFGLRNQNQAYLAFERGEVRGNSAGGISNSTSRAFLRSLVIAANLGSGVTNAGATNTTVRIDLCVIEGNSATNGAGIANNGVGAVTEIAASTIVRNVAAVAGGGVFNNGILSMDTSLVAENRAQSGGGVDHFGGSLNLVNDTLSGNTASDNGGGIYNRGSAVLKHVTLAGNAAGGSETGGNIFNDEASMSIVNSIVARADIDGNCFNSTGSIISLGHNLDSGNTCGFASSGDLIDTDPLLGPLHDNGGPTLTHVLLSGSPAVDHADPVRCTPADQRGIARPQGRGCDMGAYEAAAEPPFNRYFYLPMLMR